METSKELQIRWWVPEVGERERALVDRVIASNYINEGDVTEQFEKEVAKIIGAKYAVSCTSGTSSLFLALAGLGLRAGDEVLVPDVTFIATANAVTMTGATPVLVDADPKTLQMDVEAAAKAITPRTKAILPVHVSGRPANMAAILELAKKNKLFVVEDAAEAFASKIDGKSLGTFGHAGCFSFAPNKTITTGQGGIVVTDDEFLAQRIRMLKDQGRTKRGTGGDDIHYRVGYNFKFTNLQAAIGLGQLGVLEDRMQRMRRVHEIYCSRLKNVPGISVFECELKRGVFPLWTDCLVERRDELVEYLLSHGIECRRFWHPLHTQEPYGKNANQFPNATQLMQKALWLPSSFALSPEQVHLVCDLIEEFLGGGKS